MSEAPSASNEPNLAGPLHVSGGCLCGAVRFTAMLKAAHADVCHCSKCQRWSAGPAFATQIDGEPTIEDASTITVYASSDWGQRHFCGRCGTNLFWRAPDYGYYGVSVGALDDVSALTFTKELFIDEKPALYAFAGERQRMTGPELEAFFASMAEAGKTT
ncbi:MAG: GFA family protein [Pseudomonadota bacterium]